MTMMHDQSSSDEQAIQILKRKADKAELGKPLKKSKHCRASKAKWTQEEDDLLTRAVLTSGEGNWKKIASALHERSHLQCLHRWQKVLNPALVKGPWKEEEDTKLSELVEKYGPKDWSTIAGHIPGRIGKQCRERWFNHLSPEVRKTNWSPEEDKIIIDAHSKYGNKWTNISKLLDGRPANAIKNHWNSTLLKRIQDSNGEPTPRRDRNRNKKPSSLQRATEFDFRTQMLHQSFDESSDCSPHQYSHMSPVSSPESYHHQEVLPNTVRFHIPDAHHVYFANPYNTDARAHHTPMTAGPATINSCNIWDSWPAPNIIHLTHPPASIPVHNVPSVGAGAHSVNYGNHLAAAAAAAHNVHMTHAPLAGNYGGFNNSHNNSVLNAMNVYDADYSGLSLSESSSPEDFIEMYTSAPSSAQGSPLPAELQYCFDHPQQTVGQMHYDGGSMHSTSLPVDSSGMINSAHALSSGMNVSNLAGLLGLDSLPAYCPLEL